jgi:two-component system sensor histidine kinase and response regulator WspE
MSDVGALDPGLLDLFREEVRGNLQLLNAGLVALEEQPDDLLRIEPLMRAAHSVKGAMRVVGLDPAVQVAHALEECLVLTQKGRLSLTSAGIDVLLEGVDVLGQMSDAVGPGFAAWHAEHGDGVNELRGRLLEVSQGTYTGAATSVSAAEQVGSAHPTTPFPLRCEPPASAEPALAGGSQLTVEVPALSAVEPEQEDGELTEDEGTRRPLLELFRSELASHAQTLRDGLAALEVEPGAAGNLEPLLRAARWARSGSHIVHISSAARLSQAVEDFLMAVQTNRESPPAPGLAALRRAAELLPELGEAAAGQDLAAWLAGHEEEIAALQVQLRPPARKHVPTELVPAPAVRPATVIEEAKQPVSPPPASRPSTPVPQAGKGESDQVVRVTAQSLTRLMGLAGEALVQARWLQPFTQLLLRLKRRQARLVETLDEMGHSGLTEVREGLATCQGELDDRIHEFEEHAREADNLNSRLYREVIASRMRPFGDGTHGFPRLVRDLARQLGKKVRFEVVGDTVEVDRDILEKLEAPLNHLLRNALDHGLETPEERQVAGKAENSSLRLEARHNAGMLSILVRDDGRGISLERIRRRVIDRKMAPPDMAAGLGDDELLEFLFLPGFSTAEQVTEVSGRGVGLDVVRSMVHAVGGTVRIASQPGRGTTFHLQLPITLSVIRAVLTEIAGEPYAFPHNRINRLVRLPRAELGSLQDRQFFEVDGRNVGVVLARQVFELSGGADDLKGDDLFVVLFGEGTQEYGLVVDRFLGEQDLVVRPLDARLGKVPNISAAALLEDGAPVLIVDVDDVGRSIGKLLQTGRLQRADRPASLEERVWRVLVVDDSITVREVQRQLLAGRGYEVEVAVDGMEGWHMVRRGGFDLVISDVDMPRLDGLGLVRLIKADPELRSTPVIIVSYRDQEEQRLAGLEAGANYYLTKSSFHDETLLDVVRELIGGPR